MANLIIVFIALASTYPSLAVASNVSALEHRIQESHRAEAQLRDQAKALEIAELRQQAVADFNQNNKLTLSPSLRFDRPLNQRDLANSPVEGGKTTIEINGQACELTMRRYDYYRASTCVPVVNWVTGCWGATAPYPKGDTYEHLNRLGRLVEITGVCTDPQNRARLQPLVRGDSTAQGPIEYYEITTVQSYVQSRTNSQ